MASLNARKTPAEDATLNFLLSQDLEELIRKRLATGLYQSASEVVEEALHLL